MVIDYNAIGVRIRDIRMERGVTQAKLAELLNVSPEYVSRLERARTKLSLTTLAKIAGLLDVSLTYLLEGTSQVGNDYKLAEFSALLPAMPPNKRKLLYDIAQLLLSSNI